MGGKTKTVYVPQVDASAAAAAAYVPPASQASPTASAGDTGRANAGTAAGLGFGGTILTSGQGLVETANTTRKAVLGA